MCETYLYARRDVIDGLVINKQGIDIIKNLFLISNIFTIKILINEMNTNANKPFINCKEKFGMPKKYLPSLSVIAKVNLPDEKLEPCIFIHIISS